MKEIILTKGYKAIIDDEDFEYVNQKKWYVNIKRHGCYAATMLNGKHFGMHNFIMNPDIGLEVDHVNGNGLDNRKSNLRVCTRSQNIMNTKTRIDASSGKRGVYFKKERGRWVAQIVIDGIRKYLGSHLKKEDAITAREEAEKKLFGEYLKKGE